MRLFEWSLFYLCHGALNDSDSIFHTRFDVCNVAHFSKFKFINQLKVIFGKEKIQFTKITTPELTWSNGQGKGARDVLKEIERTSEALKTTALKLLVMFCAI